MHKYSGGRLRVEPAAGLLAAGIAKVLPADVAALGYDGCAWRRAAAPSALRGTLWRGWLRAALSRSGRSRHR